MRDVVTETQMERWRRYLAADGIPTCRMAWMDAADSPFESRAVPEVMGMYRSPIGHQRGTYFKTSKTYYDPAIWPEPMQVWRWGGRDWDDILSGAWDGCI